MISVEPESWPCGAPDPRIVQLRSIEVSGLACALDAAVGGGGAEGWLTSSGSAAQRLDGRVSGGHRRAASMPCASHADAHSDESALVDDGTRVATFSDPSGAATAAGSEAIDARQRLFNPGITCA